MRMLNILRWLVLLAFLLQVGGIVYGVILLRRLHLEQAILSKLLKTFADRSEKIAEAITTLRVNPR